MSADGPRRYQSSTIIKRLGTKALITIGGAGWFFLAAGSPDQGLSPAAANTKVVARCASRTTTTATAPELAGYDSSALAENPAVVNAGDNGVPDPVTAAASPHGPKPSVASLDATRFKLHPSVNFWRTLSASPEQLQNDQELYELYGGRYAYGIA